MELAKEAGFSVTNYDNYVMAVDFGPQPAELDILAIWTSCRSADSWTVTQPFEPLVKDGEFMAAGLPTTKAPPLPHCMP